jgi:hypothetical protein
MARRLFGVKRLAFSFGFALVAKALAAMFVTSPTACKR